jgi:hypothetical protein
MANETSQELHELNRRAILRNGLLAGFGAAVVGIASPALTGSAQAARIPRSRTAPLQPVSARTSSPRVNLGASEVTYLEQIDWAWCHKCRGLFYGPQQSSSWCPAGGQHNDSGSYNYGLLYDASGSQSGVQENWSWCNKCRGLFYGPQQSSSWCPAGGRHDGSGSYNYSLIDTALLGTQGKWAWCNKCRGLFFGPQQSSSYCPAGGQHNGSGSYDYFLIVYAT